MKRIVSLVLLVSLGCVFFVSADDEQENLLNEYLIDPALGAAGIDYETAGLSEGYAKDWFDPLTTNEEFITTLRAFAESIEGTEKEEEIQSILANESLANQEKEDRLKEIVSNAGSCSLCGRSFPIGYRYCPFDGTKLSIGAADDTGKEYAFGDIGPGGGIVFYDKGEYSFGWRYLECAPLHTEWSGIEWGPIAEIEDSEARRSQIGSGERNTEAIVAQAGPGTTYAAQLCDSLEYGGYDDWFLPSKDELNLMYENLHKEGLGDFDTANYWSSTEDSAFYSWYQLFYNGYQYYNYKNYGKNVRAIRAF